MERRLHVGTVGAGARFAESLGALVLAAGKVAYARWLDSPMSSAYHSCTGRIRVQPRSDLKITGEQGVMRRRGPFFRAPTDRGQSLLETALLLPILLLLAFNAINFGYFFFVAVNLAASPRAGVQYSILGGSTPPQLELAAPGPASNQASVSYLTYEDMRNVLPAYASATVQVCTKAVGTTGTGSSMISNCVICSSSSSSCSPGTTYPPAPDPEAPSFVLNRVDVVYSVTPIIPPFSLPTPGGPINLTMLSSMQFHRQVSMRAMD